MRATTIQPCCVTEWTVYKELARVALPPGCAYTEPLVNASRSASTLSAAALGPGCPSARIISGRPSARAAPTASALYECNSYVLAAARSAADSNGRLSAIVQPSGEYAPA